MTKEDWIEQYVAYMLRATNNDPDVVKYARESSETYWDDEEYRADGPEECASTDISYWGDY